ncbi:MAG: DegV family protein [Clostridiales bacterium]|nr:DegV family protein [Clostridiales bacterium]
MDIWIITDSAADCTPKEISELNIDILDMPVIFDGETEPCLNIDIFWTSLLSNKTAFTSQPSPEVIRGYFDLAKSTQSTVICILISSHFSGTYETAVGIKEEVGYENIYIIDSLNAYQNKKTCLTVYSKGIKSKEKDKIFPCFFILVLL